MIKQKILWFIPGVATVEQKAVAQANGLTIRNPLAYSDGAGLEECDGVTGMAPKAYAEKFGVTDEPEGCSWQGAALREDGPTVAEFVAAGYPAANYPPEGYVSRSTAQEIADAIAEQDADNNADGKMPIAKLREVLTAKGIEFDPKAKKPDLQTLLDQAEVAEKVVELKVALTEKGITFNDDATLDELKALLPAE